MYPFVQACLCQSGILLHLKRGLKGNPGIPNKISEHPDGRGQKAQNKTKKQRLGSKHQARCLNKNPGTVPTSEASEPPQEIHFLMSLFFFEVFVVHL